jgi:flavodoxin I
MTTVLIVHYSRTGNTEAMAKAVAEGVENERLEARVKRVDYTTPFDFLSADSVAFGSPCHGVNCRSLEVFL